jgi:hypothetical protein
MNVRGSPETEVPSSRGGKPGERRSGHSSPGSGKPATWRRAAVCREFPRRGNRSRGEDLMNIGEMQRKLSLWAEQDKGRKFYGLFDLISDVDWLRLAHDPVASHLPNGTPAD